MKTLAGIVSVGARTSIGLDAIQTAFLYRAGMAGMTEAAILDQNEEPFTMSILPTLDPLLVGMGRCVRLALPAFEEALAGVGASARTMRMKLLLCVDEGLDARRPDGVVPSAVLVAMLQKRAKELAPSIAIEAFARGAAAPGFVLPSHLEALASGTLDALVLGGVHSDYDPARLHALEAEGRIFTPENLDALIPGEAAAFAVLMRADVARRFERRVHAQLHEVATAFEKARPDNDDSAFEAAGLTVTMRKVGAPLVQENLKAGWLLTDLTFEMRRVHEWMSMTTRSNAIFGEPNYVDSPAHRLGHLGAAALPLHIALVTEGWRRGFAPSPVAIAYAGNDGGERAALLMSQG